MRNNVILCEKNYNLQLSSYLCSKEIMKIHGTEVYTEIIKLWDTVMHYTYFWWTPHVQKLSITTELFIYSLQDLALVLVAFVAII